MSKIIYYIGAGASYGQKESREVLDKGTENERLIVREGVPIVNEIARSLLTFKKAVEDASIDSQCIYSFKRDNYTFQNDGSNINYYRINLLRDIEDILIETQEHTTIDTYARKLFLTKKDNTFNRLKKVLSAFFVWIQLEGKADKRYDTFLANILQVESLNFPKEISVISWNYDSQFEIAYRYYNPTGSLPIYEKNVEGDLPPLDEYGRIFKINGSANFGDTNMVKALFENNDIDHIIQLIEYYGRLGVYDTWTGTILKSHLSFAWEASEKQNELMEAIKQTTKDTESVVVIGYSFPFFNRETDRAIFANMPNLKKIYIQDPKPAAVEQSLRAVLPEGSKAIISHEDDCTQFLLPREL